MNGDRKSLSLSYSLQCFLSVRRDDFVFILLNAKISANYFGHSKSKIHKFDGGLHFEWSLLLAGRYFASSRPRLFNWFFSLMLYQLLYWAISKYPQGIYKRMFWNLYVHATSELLGVWLHSMHLTHSIGSIYEFVPSATTLVSCSSQLQSYSLFSGSSSNHSRREYSFGMSEFNSVPCEGEFPYIYHCFTDLKAFCFCCLLGRGGWLLSTCFQRRFAVTKFCLRCHSNCLF